MPKSMTGFGRSITENSYASVVWEARSVNSRYLDLKWRLPLFLRASEPDLEKVVRRFADRGRLEVSCNFQPHRAEVLDISLNKPLAQAMLRSVADLATDMGHEFTPDYTRLMTISHLWQEGMKDAPPELMEALTSGLAQALEDLNVARDREGGLLAQDILRRLEKLAVWHGEIKKLAPKVKEEKFQALRTRLTSVLEKLGVEPSEERILQELAVMTDKLDVTEELTRLGFHLDQIKELLGQKGDVGKRLDFLMQEAFREINTCGNKAQSIEVSRIVVEFKGELEKCREQVQNIE
ncbi:YicC/YloC family endoribonuclease [Fundidesulfovibrio putealis]|uniref:YicC/YloC family endoribonuclease n=1 Tax=Fundidesulfovibrio putealis TaxID=270496 RepID=UPI0003FC66DC|nr:YicC/YloC family endoribonuclease [Fundidesulfovibrio putealis]